MSLCFRQGMKSSRSPEVAAAMGMPWLLIFPDNLLLRALSLHEGRRPPSPSPAIPVAASPVSRKSQSVRSCSALPPGSPWPQSSAYNHPAWEDSFFQEIDIDLVPDSHGIQKCAVQIKNRSFPLFFCHLLFLSVRILLSLSGLFYSNTGRGFVRCQKKFIFLLDNAPNSCIIQSHRAKAFWRRSGVPFVYIVTVLPET